MRMARLHSTCLRNIETASTQEIKHNYDILHAFDLPKTSIFLSVQLQAYVYSYK